MASLADFIGALMADLADARRMADEHAVLLAARSQSEPLLQGLSVPRIRLGDVVVDLPVGVQSVREPSTPEPPKANEVAARATRELKAFGARQGLELPSAAVTRFEKQYTALLEEQLTDGALLRPAVAASLAQRAVEESLNVRGTPLDDDERRRLGEAVGQAAASTVAASAATPAGLEVVVESAQVRELAQAGMATRLKLTFREEGLDVHQVDLGGDSVVRLTPE